MLRKRSGPVGNLTVSPIPETLKRHQRHGVVDKGDGAIGKDGIHATLMPTPRGKEAPPTVKRHTWRTFTP